MGGETARDDEDGPVVLGSSEAVHGGEEEDSQRVEKQRKSKPAAITPSSGINLMSNSDTSKGSKAVTHDENADKIKLIEAAKLLHIQKKVGFNFVERDGEVVKQLVEQEESDRVKKMEWEKREGDQ
jgi:hypothetical protein